VESSGAKIHASDTQYLTPPSRRLEVHRQAEINKVILDHSQTALIIRERVAVLRRIIRVRPQDRPWIPATRIKSRGIHHRISKMNVTATISETIRERFL